MVFPNLGITVEILRISGNRVRLGIDAPEDVRVLRHELADSLSSELQTAEATHRDQRASHRFRNQLNMAHIALGLAEKQLNAGLHDRALETLRRAVHQFDALDTASADSKAAGAASSSDGRPRTLLVEDDVNESELLAGYLRMSGFNVDTAEDGLQAMVHLGRYEPPDVVLLDMHLPRMSGPQTVRSIRENPDLRHMRVFAVSGASPSEMPVTIGKGGVDRWFQKPIKPQDLVNCLQSEIGASSL